MILAIKEKPFGNTIEDLLYEIKDEFISRYLEKINKNIDFLLRNGLTFRLRKEMILYSALVAENKCFHKYFDKMLNSNEKVITHLEGVFTYC